MKRLLLLTVMVAIAVSAVALIGLRSNGGPEVASAHVGAGTPHMEIDLVKETGTEWCNPVTATASRIADNIEYPVAICATNLPGSPTAFQFEVVYDPALNTCENEAYPTGDSLDDNPDANGGGSGTTFSTPNLGTGWDCNIMDIQPPDPPSEPKCDQGGAMGRAWMACMCTATNCGTLSFGAGVSAPLAVVNLKAAHVGVDVMLIQNAAAGTAEVTFITSCANPANACVGATETKTEVPPTPTPVAQCDIAVTVPMWAKVAGTPVASLTMKVGDPPAIVDVGASFTNNAVAGAPRESCSFARVFTAEIGTGDILTDTPVDPLALGVRMEPVGRPAAYGYGDVCLTCYPTHVGWTAARCVQLGHGIGDYGYPVTPAPSPPDYYPIACDEAPMGSPLPFSINNGSCEDGIDQDPHAGTCDWGGFSKQCLTPTTPDAYCLDVPLIGLIPANRVILAQDATDAPTREVKIECRARGTYPLVLAAGVGQSSISTAAPYYGPKQDPNQTNDMTFTILNVTCTKGPEMVKDCRTDIEGIQDSCNLWLMDPNFPGKVLPEPLDPADDNGCVIAAEGKGCLAVDVWLKSADDEDDPNDDDDGDGVYTNPPDADEVAECLGAWEHQVRYDHKIFKFLNELDPVGWLESEGRIANCTISVLAENWILEGCVTKDATGTGNEGMQLGPCGDGIIEKMLIIPLTNDLIYRGVFRPTKDNGVVTNIVDDNCEITDIYAEPMADTLPGGLTPICGDLHITVRMLEGDIDLDCDVDVVDDQALAFRYGASWGLQLYDQWFDLEPKFADQDIDIKDLQFVFGRNYSTCQAPIPDDQAIPVDPAQP